MKTCRICRAEKPYEDFPKDPRLKCGRKSRCKECIAGQQKLRNSRNKSADLSLSDNLLLTKCCCDCNTQKPREQFWRNSGFKDGRNNRCPECEKKREDTKNPEDLKRFKERKYNAARKFQLKKYSLTVEQFDEMSLTQGGMCAICGLPEPQNKLLAVDHNHSTGRVRGLLCSNCNRAIGLLKESLDVVTKVARYLEKHSIP